MEADRVGREATRRGTHEVLVARGTFLAFGDLCSPVSGTHIARVPREEPVVSLEVLDAVLTLAVRGLVEFLNDPGARRFRSAVVGINVVHKYGEALGVVAGIYRAGAAGSCACQQDPCVAEVHLSAIDGIAAAVVLDKAARRGEPRDRTGNIPVNDMRQQNIGRYGTVLQHLQIV